MCSVYNLHFQFDVFRDEQPISVIYPVLADFAVVYCEAHFCPNKFRPSLEKGAFQCYYCRLGYIAVKICSIDQFVKGGLVIGKNQLGRGCYQIVVIKKFCQNNAIEGFRA
jgi:hypothetical protein